MFSALNKHKFSVGNKVEKWIRTNQNTVDLAAGVVIAVEIDNVFVQWDNLDGNFIEKWERPEAIQLRDWNTRKEEQEEARQRIYKYYDGLTCTVKRAFWERVKDTFTERHEVLMLELLLSEGLIVNRPADDLLHMNKPIELSGTIQAVSPDVWEGSK